MYVEVGDVIMEKCRSCYSSKQYFVLYQIIYIDTNGLIWGAELDSNDEDYIYTNGIGELETINFHNIIWKEETK